MLRIRTPLLLLLMIVVTTTAVRIEWLNVQAGGILPNRELRGDGSPVKWRAQAGTTEESWIQLCGPKDEQGRAVPLNESERAKMQEEIAHARANNRLRDVVSSWGLLQYVLVPMAIALSIWIWIKPAKQRSDRMLTGVGLFISIAAGVSACARGYFTSLGW